MPARRAVAALLLLAACLGLTGCWDRRELEEDALILALGLDPAPGNQLAVTVLVAVPGKLAGGKQGTGGGDQPYVIAQVQAPDVASAMNLLQTFVGRRPSLLHGKVLVLGEELARRGTLGPLNQLVRFRQARRSMYVVVAEGKAGDWLRVIKPNIEREPTRYIEFMIMAGRYTSMIPDMAQLHEFATSVGSPGADPLALLARLHTPGTGPQPGQAPPQATPDFAPGEVPRQGVATADMTGTALFRGDKLVGTLSGEETRILQMLRGHYYRSLYSMRDPVQPGQWVTVDLRRARQPDIGISRRGDRVEVNTQVGLEAELNSQSGTTDFTAPENRLRLEDALGRQLAGEAAALLRKVQRWQSDACGFGERARRLFATWDEWQAFDWRRQWPRARANAAVRVQVRRYGMQTLPVVSR